MEPAPLACVMPWTEEPAETTTLPSASASGRHVMWSGLKWKQFAML